MNVLRGRAAIRCSVPGSVRRPVHRRRRAGAQHFVVHVATPVAQHVIEGVELARARPSGPPPRPGSPPGHGWPARPRSALRADDQAAADEGLAALGAHDRHRPRSGRCCGRRRSPARAPSPGRQASAPASAPSWWARPRCPRRASPAAGRPRGTSRRSRWPRPAGRTRCGTPAGPGRPVRNTGSRRPTGAACGRCPDSLAGRRPAQL